MDAFKLSAYVILKILVKCYSIKTEVDAIIYIERSKEFLDGDIMEINEGMKENKEAAHICNIPCASMPLLGDANFGLAQKPIIHVDRSADFNVMIYLLKGKMEVIEDGTVYELNPGSLLFLKKHVHHWGIKEFGVGTAWYYIHFYSDDITKGMQPLEKQAIRKTNLIPDDYQYYISLPKMLNLPLGNELEREEDKEYTLNHAPVREQKKAVGHAVRAVYLYTGMADLAATTKDDSLAEACRVLCNNITGCRMYLTGGIGSAYEGEAFTKDYHLPNDTAYAETCASIGLIFFGRKMIDIEKNGKYADEMERALYNCVLAGMQLDGKRFFYVNPLESLPGISGEAATHRHALPQRPKWFVCSCCPPNVARLLPSIGCYAWSEEENTVYSHLFIGGTLDLTDTLQGKISVETEYPYDGNIVYRFEPMQESMDMTLAIRMPSFSDSTQILLNGEKAHCIIKDGYAYLTHSFTRRDVISVVLGMNVKRVFAANEVSSDSGKVAFTRGPLVYCFEGVDNGDDVLGLRVKKEAVPLVGEYDAAKLEGIVELTIDGYRIEKSGTLYSTKRPKADPCVINAVPYYAWGNRGLNQMRVWMPEME